MPPHPDGRWRSYCNVIMANKTLLVPTFPSVDRKLESRAINLYRQLLPGWEIVGVPSDALSQTSGLLRCFTLPVPGFVEGPFASRLLAPRYAMDSMPIQHRPGS